MGARHVESKLLALKGMFAINRRLPKFIRDKGSPTYVRFETIHNTAASSACGTEQERCTM